MSRRVNKNERAFRRAVAIEYIQNGKKRQEICLKYGLKNIATLSNWVSNYLTPYEIQTKCVSLHPEEVLNVDAMKQNQESEVDIQAQSARIEALEKQLSDLQKKLKRSEDKNLALNTLIDIAEEQGVRIRKKSGVKQ